ncbi:MAG: hypothetical protein ACTSWC_07460 [Promethearchaeota archaeon]
MKIVAGFFRKGNLHKWKKTFGFLLLIIFLSSSIIQGATWFVKGTSNESTIFIPTQTLTFSSESEIISFEIFNSKMYAITSNEVIIYDISDSLNPTEIYEIPVNNSISTGTLSENGQNLKLYLSLSNGSLLIFDVSEPTFPRLMKSQSINQTFSQILVKDVNIFGMTSKSVYFYNISQENRINFVGKIFGTQIHAIQYDSPYLFIAQTQIGLQIVDFSNFTHPVNQSCIEDAVDGFDLALDIPNDIIYLAAGKAGILSVYISNMSNIVVVNKLNQTVPVKNVFLNGSFLFTRFDSGGLCLFYIDLPGYPVLVDYLESTNTYGKINLSGTTLFVQNYPNKIQIFDCKGIEGYLSNSSKIKLKTILQVGGFLLFFMIILAFIAKKVSPKYSD